MVKFSQQAAYLESSAIRNKAFDNPDIIKFSAGRPETAFFPLADITTLLQNVLAEHGGKVLQYAASEGLYPLREIIAEKCLPGCGVSLKPQNMMIVSGSQEGIEFSARLLVNAGDVIICENPSYSGAFGAFAPYRPAYVTVPMDEDGMRMDALERILQTTPQAKMIYTIPDFQNPTGITMSLERRERLARLAAQYEVPVIEDRPYGDLIFEGKPLPAVKSFDKDGWVVMLGSFSKILCPGLRLAWLCAPDKFMGKYVQIKESASLQSSTLDQYIAWDYLRKYDLQAHIDQLIAGYRARRDTVLRCIAEYFPAGVKYTRPAGGFFIWVELNPEIDTAALLQKSLEIAKVAYVPGAAFFVNDKPGNFLRLSYSCVDEAQIETGLKRLGDLLKASVA